MAKYNLQYVIRHCKNFAKQAGWTPTETDFINNFATIILVSEEDDPLNTSPQKLINDLLLLMSATNYTVDDAVIADDVLFLKIAPLPAGCIKKVVCTVSMKQQSAFNFTTNQPERSKHHA